MTLFSAFRRMAILATALAVLATDGRCWASSIDVDCSVDQGPARHVANGYLSSISLTQPGSHMITPIKPSTIREGRTLFPNYWRFHGLGIRDFQFVIASMFVGPDDPIDFQTIGYSVSLSQWSAYVAEVVNDFKARGMDIKYDIFNEPDIAVRPIQTHNDLYIAWKAAYQAIRANNPSAKIVGPSTAYMQNLRPFLLRVKAEGTFPDIVSFHYYGDPAGVRPTIADLRSWMAANGMGNPPISVNEILGQHAWINAGYIAGTLAAVDRSGVVSAHHACWPDPNGGECCGSPVLDGLLDRDAASPRAGWWVYKGYADVTGRLVNLTTNTDRMDGIAGLDAQAGGGTALIGKYGDWDGDTPLTIRNLNYAPWLIQNGRVRVTALRIPNTQAAPLHSLATTVNVDAVVNNNSIQVVLPTFNTQDAYIVRFGPFGGSVTPTPTPTPVPTPVPTPTPTPTAQAPYNGTPFAVPGTITVSQYDKGGEGVAYHDNDATNHFSNTYRPGEGVDCNGSAIGWGQAPEWVEYTVNVAAAGTYTISIPVAYPGTGPSIHVSFNGVNVTGALAVPNTGGWNIFRTISKTVTLNAGTQVMQVVYDVNGADGYGPDLSDITITSVSNPTPTPTPTPGNQSPYNGAAMAVPGTIRTAQYDNGGEGVAYHDTDSVNQMSSTYRTGTGVDSNGSGIGWISASEWLEYTVHVSASGSYAIAIPVSHPGNGGSMHVKFNGVNVTGSLGLPNTGSWSTYQNINATVNLSAGTQVMMVSFDTNGSTGYGPGLGDIVIASAGGGGGGGGGSQTPYNGTAMTVPGLIRTAQYDNGGEGVAYHDTDSVNQMSSTYRAGTGVDSNGSGIGWISASEWLEYTINVSPPAGFNSPYYLVIPVSHPGTGGTMHVSIDGVNVTGALNLPNTGSWSTYQNMVKQVNIAPGLHVMSVVFDTNGSTGYGPGLGDITVAMPMPAPSGTG